MIHFRLRYQRLLDRLGQVHRRARLLRAAWLALLVPLGGLSAHLAGYLPLAPLGWLVGGGVLFLAASWRLQRRPAEELGRLLDRRYALDDLLVTAVEVDRRGVRSVVEGRLLDDAATAMAVLGDERAIEDHSPRREAETLVALLLIVAGLWLLAGTVGRPRPVERLGPLPGFGAGQGEGRSGGNLTDGSGPGAGPGAAAGALGILAAALGDHAAARELAAALAAGDAAAAARAARSLADRSAELSPAGRRELAGLLHQAADQLAQSEPALAEAVRQAARALESPAGGPAGVERLAAELDALVAQPAAASAAPASGPHARVGPMSRRLPVRPTAVPLAAPGRGVGAEVGVGPAVRPGPAGDRQPAGSPVRGGVVVPGPAMVGPDPLRYPWAWRQTVRRYFGPEVRRP